MSRNPFASWTQADIDRHNARVTGKPVEQPKPTSKAVEIEGDLHDQIDEHCRQQGYLVIHARMDMPSTIAVGHPDFTIFMPEMKCCFIECKAKGKKATIDQLSKIAHARKLGFVAEIVDNFDDAKSVIERAKQDVYKPI